MITYDKAQGRSQKRHYLVVKNLSRLLREITSSHDGDFYCLNCFHLYSRRDTLKKYESI